MKILMMVSIGAFLVPLFLFFAEIIAQHYWIQYMCRCRLSQKQKAYGPQLDVAIKEKVPSMGGIVFLLIGSGLLISSVFRGNQIHVAFWCCPLLVGTVGLIDDVLKFRNHSSEGLKSLQKFTLQTAAVVIWFFLLRSLKIVPLLCPDLFIGDWIWPFALFLAVGLLNAVNVTDGLDGLAAGASAISFGILILLIPLKHPGFFGATTGLAVSLGFLWHNAYPAQVFMGDAGAHFLAGLMISCAFVGESVVLLIPAGVGFGIEMISVVIQIIAIRGFGRKVFRMSPIHHHFQLLGWPETKIVVRFWLIHLICSTSCAVVYACLGR